MIQQNTEYTDEWDRQAVLTDDELRRFNTICKDCLRATGIEIPIICDDHDKYGKKHSDALGIIHASNKEKPLAGECFITIDNYFIHECFESTFHGKIKIISDTIESVIAHELSHTLQWAHCKRHRRLTEELHQKIIEYQKSKESLRY